MQKISVQPLPTLSSADTEVSILRLDQLHPVVSGNKWFKLKYYLQDARQKGYSSLGTFGGAYSNHIVATAFAASEAGLHSIGYIRGEAPAVLSPTLQQAKELGMELRYISRPAYKNRHTIVDANDPFIYWIEEGGYGLPGAAGAAEIMNFAPAGTTHVLCAIGTGTMMAGLIKAAVSCQVTGIGVLKNETGGEEAIKALLTADELNKPREILHDYHFGGYAKHPPELIHFMKSLWAREQLPTDIVYTSKLLFAAQDLVTENHFPAGSRLLIIHSGGLQGNRSLPAGILPF